MTVPHLSARAPRRPRRASIGRVRLAGPASLLGATAFTAAIALSAGLSFDFLLQRAGFQISEAVLKVGAADPVWLTLAAGLVNSARVSAVAIMLALPLGILLALLRGSALRPARWLAGAIIEPVRNTPVLLQLFLWYGIATQALPAPRQALTLWPGLLLCNRGLFVPWPNSGGLEWPELSGFNIEGGLALSTEFTVLVFGLGLFHACYLAEIFRAGFRAVPEGQREASRALALPRIVAFRKIVLPQALGFALPALALQLLALVKNSALGVAIGYPDFVAVLNTTVNRNGRALEGLILTILAYFALNRLLGAAIETAGRRLGPAARGELSVAPTRPSSERRRWSPIEGLLLAALLVPLCLGLARAFSWAIVDAVWLGSPATCHAGHGACWAVVTEKFQLLAFGPYPAAEIWRPALATLFLAGALASLGLDRFRHGRAGLAALGFAMAAWLWLLGGGAGLVAVPTNSWGGLSLTIGLAAGSVGLACLLALPLALARLSAVRPVAASALAFVEIFRSVPLVALLLSADLLMPLLLPSGWAIDKLWRAAVAITLLATVNLAEVLRGALLSVPSGQAEAARALGLPAAKAFLLVTLPQATRIALPATVNVFVGAIKDTSLVAVVGLLDVTGAAKAAVADPSWRSFSPELYLVLALVYFGLCYPVARLARSMEAQPNAARAARKRSTSAASL